MCMRDVFGADSSNNRTSHECLSSGSVQTKGLFSLCPQAALPKLASQFFGAVFGRP
jgi:hypothetical protein